MSSNPFSGAVTTAAATDAVILSLSSSASESSELDLSESMAATAAFSVDNKRFLILLAFFFLTVVFIMACGKCKGDLRAAAATAAAAATLVATTVPTMVDCIDASEGERETVRDTAPPGTLSMDAPLLPCPSDEDDGIKGGGGPR